MPSNRKIYSTLLKWARYQGRCTKAARQIVSVPGYQRAYVSWYRTHKRKMQGLGPSKRPRVVKPPTCPWCHKEFCPEFPA